jgi:hypothetical protein
MRPVRRDADEVAAVAHREARGERDTRVATGIVVEEDEQRAQVHGVPR